jgi:hypothetical protein
MIQFDCCLDAAVLPNLLMLMSSNKPRKMSLETATYHPIAACLLDRRNPCQIQSFPSLPDTPITARPKLAGHTQSS